VIEAKVPNSATNLSGRRALAKGRYRRLEFGASRMQGAESQGGLGF
jgi:hypothetical protein